MNLVFPLTQKIKEKSNIQLMNLCAFITAELVKIYDLEI